MVTRLFGRKQVGPDAPGRDSGGVITPQQKAYFDTFGFLRVPGLFAGDTDRLVEGFEEVFANEDHPRMETFEELHLDERRVIIPQFVTKTPKLSWLLDDPRVVATVSTLLDPGYEYAQSDGNLFYCESSWHPDTYGAPLTRPHVKLSFYLDSLHGESGAIRMIPGTNHHRTPFAKALRANLEDPRGIIDVYGVDAREIPSWTLESEPGDVIAWDFRTIHASFHGAERRRLFSINFRGSEAPA